MVMLNSREKRLLFLVLTTGLLLAWVKIRSSGMHTVSDLSARLNEIRTQLERSQKLLTSVSDVEKSRTPSSLPEANTVTLSLLSDLTAPKQTAGVNVISVENGTNSNYVVTAKGEFSQMMRFLSFMEREQSKFKVESVEFKKLDTQAANSTEEDAPMKEIRGVFNLSRRG
jgi:hypothetical protein